MKAVLALRCFLVWSAAAAAAALLPSLLLWVEDEEEGGSWSSVGEKETLLVTKTPFEII